MNWNERLVIDDDDGLVAIHQDAPDKVLAILVGSPEAILVRWVGDALQERKANAPDVIHVWVQGFHGF